MSPTTTALEETKAMSDPTPMSRIQFLVDYMDAAGILMDGAFTFPDGTTVWATGSEPSEPWPDDDADVYQHSFMFEDSE